jgi:S1-C subfamily serine protease
MRGELVGINSAIFTRSGGNIGIGFAVPTEIAGSIMKQILDFGEVRRGLLGVTIATINPETAKALGAEVDHGALVADVQPDSAAEKAGLKVDDIIVEVNNERINNNRDLANAIGLRGPGEEVEIKYLRGGDTRTTTAELGERTLQQIAGEDVHSGLAGAQFSAASTTRADGVEVSDVAPRSPAAQRGLQPGDVIIAVNRVRVGTVEELQEIAAQNQILFLLIRREGRQLLLQIR